MSKGNSFIRNDFGGPSPLQSLGASNGISFSREFEHFLKYIAVTAGNTTMP